MLFSPPTEDDDENNDSSEVPDYSQLRLPSAKTLTTLEDANTKLYIGTEVNIRTGKVNHKQYFTSVQVLNEQNVMAKLSNKDPNI